MTQLELVKHEQVVKGNQVGMQRTVIAVSTSYNALEKFCEQELGGEIGEIGDQTPYYTIQDTKITIVQFNY